MIVMVTSLTKQMAPLNDGHPKSYGKVCVNQLAGSGARSLLCEAEAFTGSQTAPRRWRGTVELWQRDTCCCSLQGKEAPASGGLSLGWEGSNEARAPLGAWAGCARGGGQSELAGIAKYHMLPSFLRLQRSPAPRTPRRSASRALGLEAEAVPAAASRLVRALGAAARPSSRAWATAGAGEVDPGLPAPPPASQGGSPVVKAAAGNAGAQLGH
ncbi:unnamed protein product [Eretmochelys imbricata]